MKQLLLFIFSIGASWIFAQSGIYSADLISDPINLNLQQLGTAQYAIAGAENSTGQYQGFYSVHQAGVSVFSVSIDIEQSSTIISDQVLLPSGNTIFTGVFRGPAGTHLPFVMEIDPAGNTINAMAYDGFPFPETETHKIIFSEHYNRLFICGTTRVTDPLQSAFSPTQEAFVLSIEPDGFNVHWCSFMDSGISNTPTPTDYDLAEDLALTEEGILIVTGSMNEPGSSAQLLMVGAIDPDNGFSFYANGWHLGANAAGAAIHQIFHDQYYVLINSTSGMALACFDLTTGNVNGPAQIIGGFLPGNQLLTGYVLEGRFDVAEATIGGYINDISPNALPKLRPFQIVVQMGTCTNISLPQDGTFFQADNAFGPSLGAFAEFVQPDFVNTPDILIADDGLLRIVGFRGLRYDIAATNPSGLCISTCETPFQVFSSGQTLNSPFQTVFNPFPVIAVTVEGHTTPRNENLQDECQSQGLNCAQTCPVTVTQICPTEFSLGINCVDPCYGPPSFFWSIPSLPISNPTSPNPIVSTASGGTHNYTLQLTYLVNGIPEICTYSGTITLPAVTCNTLQFNLNVSPINNCGEYQLAITDNAFGCLDIDYSIYIQRMSPFCTIASAQAVPAVSTFDITSCGPGYYQIYGVAYVQYNGQTIGNCYLGSVIQYLDDYSFEPNIVSVGVNGTGPCAPGVTSYIEAEVTNAASFPSNSSCYDYYWNGVLGGPIHYCCYNGISNCNQIDLLIVDNCTGCSFYKPDIYLAPIMDGGGGTIVQEFENTSFDDPNLIELYPNPAIDALHVKLNPQSEASILDVYDVHGKLWLKAALLDSETTLDISRLPGGTYIVKALDVLTGTSEVLRFVKL